MNKNANPFHRILDAGDDAVCSPRESEAETPLTWSRDGGYEGFEKPPRPAALHAWGTADECARVMDEPTEAAPESLCAVRTAEAAYRRLEADRSPLSLFDTVAMGGASTVRIRHPGGVDEVSSPHCKRIRYHLDHDARPSIGGGEATDPVEGADTTEARAYGEKFLAPASYPDSADKIAFVRRLLACANGESHMAAYIRQIEARIVRLFYLAFRNAVGWAGTAANGEGFGDMALGAPLWIAPGPEAPDSMVDDLIDKAQGEHDLNPAVAPRPRGIGDVDPKTVDVWARDTSRAGPAFVVATKSYAALAVDQRSGQYQTGWRGTTWAFNMEAYRYLRLPPKP